MGRVEARPQSSADSRVGAAHSDPEARRNYFTKWLNVSVKC